MEKKDFTKDVVRCFDEKINTIKSIVYHYNLLDMIPNFIEMNENERKQKIEDIINFYLNKIKEQNSEEIIRKHRSSIDDITEFFNYSYFDKCNDTMLSNIQEEAEYIADSFVQKLFTTTGNKLILPVRYEDIKNYCIISTIDEKYTDYVFLWIILKLAVVYNYSNNNN